MAPGKRSVAQGKKERASNGLVAYSALEVLALSTTWSLQTVLSARTVHKYQPTQVRTGHGSFGKYFCRILREPNSGCPHCADPGDEMNMRC